MMNSLQALMKGLIDYAGLFPPADLDLDPAIRNYARYRAAGDSGMLSRFIIPAARLEELAPYAGMFAETGPFLFSVLGYPALKMNVFEAAQTTVADALAFEAHHDGHVLADRFEFKLQPEVLELSAMADLHAQLEHAFAEKLKAPSRAFFEVPLMGEKWEAGVDKAVRAIADGNAVNGKDTFGLKLRCGGVMPSAFPDVEAIAFTLLRCRDADIPFKATAGLHHPVRHYSEEVGSMMHGFLNVFGGAILGSLHDLDSSSLERLLGDEHAEHFVFSDDSFMWMEWGASVEEITTLRAHFATTFGSCSFDEPREDLVELGFLAPGSDRV